MQCMPVAHESQTLKQSPRKFGRLNAKKFTPSRQNETAALFSLMNIG